MRDPEFVERSQRLLAVPIKRARTQPVEYLDDDELRAMLEAVDPRKPDGQRDYAMLLTLFNTGARVQELLDLRPIDLQFRTAAGANHVAALYLRAGENDLALEWLERSFDAGDPEMAHLGVEPLNDAVRNDPRFQDLLRRMNLPE